MKAITIYQPYATLIMEGFKRWELRSWDIPSKIIGEDVVIHAARLTPRLNDWETVSRTLGLLCDAQDQAKALFEQWREDPQKLPLGCGLGVVRFGQAQRAQWLDEGERKFWAWPIGDVRKFRQTVPAKGGQGLWTWGGDSPL